MPETTLPPCPACGGGDSLAQFAVTRCFTCGTVLRTDAWRRLADAARLAAAVGRLERMMDIVTAVRGDTWEAWSDGIPRVAGATLAEALTRLGGEVGDGE